MKRKRKTRTDKPAGPGPLKRWWTGLDAGLRRRAILGAIQAILLVGLVAGALWGLLELRRYVQTRPGVAASQAVLELADRPDWMPNSLAEEIRAELMGGTDARAWTYDPDLVRQVGQAAAACPWIAQVREVRVEASTLHPGEAPDAAVTGRIVVRAEYRRPVARILDGREYCIDAQGVLLPPHQARELMAGLPQIVNQAARAPSPGQVWAGADVQAALAVLRLLADRPYYREITAVDVNNQRGAWQEGQSPIVLFAAGEEALTRIVFGALPTEKVPIVVNEPSVDRKVGYLDGWYQVHRQRLAGPKELDLTYPELLCSPRDYPASVGITLP